MIYRKLLTLALLLISSSVFAGTMGISRTKTITIFQTYENYATVWLDTPVNDTLSCPSQVKGQAYVIDWSTSSEAKGLYNAALAAFLLNKTVGFGVTDSTCHPWANGTAVIYRVDMGQ